MRALTITLFMCFMTTVNAQKLRDTVEGKSGIFFDLGVKSVTNNGLNEMNALLAKRNLTTIDNNMVCTNFGLFGEFKKGYLRMYYSAFRSVKNDRQTTDNQYLIPHFTGYGFTIIGTRKLLNKKRWTIDAGGGFSVNRFNFVLADSRPLPISFDSLLSIPAASPAALDYAQQHYNWNIEARIGFSHRTKLFKKSSGGCNFSGFLGYSQPFNNGRNWTQKNSPKVAVKDFPKTSFNSFYAQFGLDFYFKNKRVNKS
jgi:hypothetical protein